jgi:hypothetical protein
MQLIFFFSVLFIPLCIILLIGFKFGGNLFSNFIIVCLKFLAVFVLLVIALNFFNSKTEVSISDIYGEYIIDREKCAGKQADWQYNHYRFKITEDNKIFFYITEKENIVKTIEGKVAFYEDSASPHLKIDLEEPKFHILKENPTLYREIWSFYYVFESDKYKNVFFTKGNWKTID